MKKLYVLLLKDRYDERSRLTVLGVLEDEKRADFLASKDWMWLSVEEMEVNNEEEILNHLKLYSKL